MIRTVLFALSGINANMLKIAGINLTNKQLCIKVTQRIKNYIKKLVTRKREKNSTFYVEETLSYLKPYKDQMQKLYEVTFNDEIISTKLSKEEEYSQNNDDKSSRLVYKSKTKSGQSIVSDFQ